MVVIQMITEAALLEQFNGSLQLRKLSLAAPGRQEILVRMVSASVCHTDIAAIEGEFGRLIPLPMVLGHEGAGVVEAVGDGVKKFKKGDRVVLSVVVHCDNCRNCAAGRPSACENFNEIAFGGGLNDGSKRLSLDGRQVSHFFAQSSFSRYAVVPENVAVHVPDEVQLEKLSVLSCGVQTGSGAVMNSGIPLGSKLAIFGCGGVGLSAVMGAKVIGAREIIAIDVADERLSLARELGATEVINPKKLDAVERVKSISGGGVDYAIECVGRTETIVQAVDCLRPWGTVILVGVPRRGTKIEFDFFSLFRATVRGCVAGFANSELFLPLLISLNQEGKFPFEKLSPGSYRFEEINGAIGDMRSAKVIKPILRF